MRPPAVRVIRLRPEHIWRLPSLLNQQSTVFVGTTGVRQRLSYGSLLQALTGSFESNRPFGVFTLDGQLIAMIRVMHIESDKTALLDLAIEQKQHHAVTNTLARTVDELLNQERVRCVLSACAKQDSAACKQLRAADLVPLHDTATMISGTETESPLTIFGQLSVLA